MSLATQASLHDPDARLSGARGLELVRGRGCHLWDSEGRRYFDASAQYGVASLGHAHPALARAIARQAEQLLSCFASFDSPARRALCARLVQLLAPLDAVYLCNSGAETVEAARKLARACTGRPGAVALAGAFHGRTLGAVALQGDRRQRARFALDAEQVRHVRPGSLEQLDAALTEDVGLMLVEVVQGEGGVRPVEGAYLREAQALCRERGVLFGIDEVQTGIGRTGRWFAYQHHELEPDLVCVAKGLGGGVPIGALVARSSELSQLRGAHGSTFGGNPLACAAALAVLDELSRTQLIPRVALYGARLAANLSARLASAAPGRVRAVRGLGLMIGIELDAPVAPVLRTLQERGVIALSAGPRVLRLLPPLNASWGELEQLGEDVAGAIAC